MTISTTSNTAVGQGNGLTTSFDFSFPVPLASELFVFLTDSSGAQTPLSPTQYSVTGIGTANGGAVTYPLTGSPIPTGSSITIQRILPFQQLTDLVNQSGYYPNVVENALDYLTMLTQQLEQGLQLCLQVPIAANPPDLTLPPVSGRALGVIGFDQVGNAIIYPLPASVGAGSLRSEGPFVAGTNFTPGVTTTLSLTQAYGSTANVSVHFDGTYQGPDQYSIVGSQITFNSPIPVGTSRVYIVGGTTLSAYIPSTGSVGQAQMQPNSIGQAQLQTDSVGSAQLQANSVGNSEIQAGSIDPTKIANLAAMLTAMGGVSSSSLNNAIVQVASAAGNNSSVNPTVSFTAPVAGTLIAIGIRNNSLVDAAGHPATLAINSITQASDSTELSTVHVATASCGAGPVSANYSVSAGIAFSAYLALIYLPNHP